LSLTLLWLCFLLFASLQVQRTARRLTREASAIGSRERSAVSLRRLRCPGGLYSTIYLHVQTAAQGDKEFVKGGSVVAGLNARADAIAQCLTYTFATPVLGGQAAFSVLGDPGHVDVGIDATLTGPRGNTISGSTTDHRTTFADVFYQGTLKWNQRVHTTMVYVTGNIPSGTYDNSRLANLSFGWVAVDGGAGYTYFDPKTGHEFSVNGPEAALTGDCRLFRSFAEN
jgi:hypothetical protein